MNGVSKRRRCSVENPVFCQAADQKRNTKRFERMGQERPACNALVIGLRTVNIQLATAAKAPLWATQYGIQRRRKENRRAHMIKIWAEDGGRGGGDHGSGENGGRDSRRMRGGKAPDSRN